jgi:tRNA threonylcarbamoyladenosine biosynthesis protein TsaE
MNFWTFDSRDADETLERGEDLGRSLGVAGLAIALIGPLGAGKTVFVKGLAKGLGVDPRLVSSPTFVIAQQYPVATGPMTLHHVDLYRLESEDELETIGFYDMLAPGNVVAVEWADRFEDVLGRSFLAIEFGGPTAEEEEAAREEVAWRGRRAQVTAHGDAAERILSDWAARVDRQHGAAGSAPGTSPAMRVLTMVLVAIGLFLGQRATSSSALVVEEPSCESLVALEADELGTWRAGCRAIRTTMRVPPSSIEESVEVSTEPSTSLSGMARWLDGRRVDVNEASPALLERLPAIGPARAEAIVRERERGEGRGFASLRDLERVAGIGPRIRRSLEAWLSVGRSDGGTATLQPMKDEQDG